MVYWRQNRTDLYAFDSGDLVRFNLNVSPGSALCIADDHCFLRKEGETESDADTSTLTVIKAGEGLEAGFILHSSEELWQPINRLKPAAIALKSGLQIRFGRSRFTVEALVFPAECISDTANSDISDNQTIDRMCRICLSGERESGNPLLSICKCAGTQQLIHLHCAKAFIHSKLRTNDSPCVESFLVSRSVVCDLCHEELPLTHVDSGTQYTLRGEIKPQSAYVKLVSDSDPNEFHIVHPALHKAATIGRARTCDLKLFDASVSRLHASITHTEAGFIIRDEDSKFGSLVRAPGDLPLPYNRELILQVRQSLLTLRAVKPCKILKCCCCRRRVNRRTEPPDSTQGNEKAEIRQGRRYEEEAPLDCQVSS